MNEHQWCAGLQQAGLERLRKHVLLSVHLSAEEPALAVAARDAGVRISQDKLNLLCIEGPYRFRPLVIRCASNLHVLLLAMRKIIC